MVISAIRYNNVHPTMKGCPSPMDPFVKYRAPQQKRKLGRRPGRTRRRRVTFMSCPPCLRRRGGNGERCYGACAHGVAQSHCRILYHISRGEVRTKSSPCAKSRGAHLHPPHPVSMYNNAYIERSDSFVPKCTDSSTSIYHSQHIEFDYRNTIYQSGLH